MVSESENLEFEPWSRIFRYMQLFLLIEVHMVGLT
jgi:hypothetical protein